MIDSACTYSRIIILEKNDNVLVVDEQGRQHINSSILGSESRGLRVASFPDKEQQIQKVSITTSQCLSILYFHIYVDT